MRTDCAAPRLQCHRNDPGEGLERGRSETRREMERSRNETGATLERH